eukprot:361362-Pyramimonas_sp.AAC.1
MEVESEENNGTSHDPAGAALAPLLSTLGHPRPLLSTLLVTLGHSCPLLVTHGHAWPLGAHLSAPLCALVGRLCEGSAGLADRCRAESPRLLDPLLLLLLLSPPALGSAAARWISSVGWRSRVTVIADLMATATPRGAAQRLLSTVTCIRLSTRRAESAQKPPLPASDWSIVRIYPRFLRLIGSS